MIREISQHSRIKRKVQCPKMRAADQSISIERVKGWGLYKMSNHMRIPMFILAFSDSSLETCNAVELNSFRIPVWQKAHPNLRIANRRVKRTAFQRLLGTKDIIGLGLHRCQKGISHSAMVIYLKRWRPTQATLVVYSVDRKTKESLHKSLRDDLQLTKSGDYYQRGNRKMMKGWERWRELVTGRYKCKIRSYYVVVSLMRDGPKDVRNRSGNPTHDWGDAEDLRDFK